jgi:hypothetical protein
MWPALQRSHGILLAALLAQFAVLTAGVCSTLARLPSPAHPCAAGSVRTLILILLFQRGLSRWYTTSKREARSGKSTAVMSIKHLN